MDMTKKQKVLILAGSGTGKSTAARLYKNVVDIDTIDYMFKYDQKRYGKLSAEDLKNLINGWLANPANYEPGSIRQSKFFGPLKFYFAMRKALKSNIVLIPLIPETFTGMQAVFGKARKILVLPDKEIFGEYAERFRERGNDENFIKMREADHKALWELFEKHHEYEAVILETGEFLPAALKKIDVILTPRAIE